MDRVTVRNMYSPIIICHFLPGTSEYCRQSDVSDTLHQLKLKIANLAFLVTQPSHFQFLFSLPVYILYHNGVDVPRIESRCGRDFRHASSPALGHTQPPLQ